MSQMKRYLTVSATDDPRLDPAPEAGAGDGARRTLLGQLRTLLQYLNLSLYHSIKFTEVDKCTVNMYLYI